MATLIGVVSQVVGEVYAVAGDGTRRPLVEGDRVYAGEQLVTGANGAIAVTMTNGQELTVGRDSSMALNEQMLAGAEGTPPASPEDAAPAAPSDSDLTDVEQLQAAIEAGVDPTLEGEATAAGPGAGGGGGGAGGVGGGHSFVLLGETGGALDPTIGFPTEGLNSGPEFPDAEPIVTPDPEAPDFTPDIDIEYQDQSGTLIAGPAIVDEEGLADGTNPGSNAEQASGIIVINSPDGLSSLQVQDVNGNWIDVTNGGVVQGQYGTLTVSAGGAWTYTLTDNTFDHGNPNATGAADQVGESFPVRMFDLDGDVSPTVQLNVLVNDDGPILTEGEGAQVAAIVDEDETSDGISDGDSVTNVASGGPGTLSALVNFGADGIGSFGLSGSSSAIASMEAQGLTSGGTALSYSVVGNVLTASAGGETIFTLQVGANGSFTFTLIGQLDHPTPDGNDNELLELPIDFSGVLSATDGDGDSVGTFTPGSFVIDVEDDVPQLASRSDGEEQLIPSVWNIVHEDALTTGAGAPHEGNPEGGQTTTVSGPAGSLSALVDFGADGPGAFSLSSDLSSMDLQALTSGGVALTYGVVGNVLTASAGGETIFTLTVNGDGSWEFVLQGPIDHPIADGSFDSEDLPGLGVDFSGILIATDGDGDPLVGGFPSGSFAVDIEDDVPSDAVGEGSTINGLVHEDALSSGSGAPYQGNPDGLGQTTTISGGAGALHALVSFGADGPGTFNLSTDVSSLELQALTSEGTPLSYSVVGDVLTATANGNTIFTLTVNDDGSYEFVLGGPIDHPVADGTLDSEQLAGLGIDFSALLIATDGDGDPLAAGFPAGSFTVNVEDDVPVPTQDDKADINLVVQEDALTLGGGAPYEGNEEGVGQSTTVSGGPGALFALIDFGADGPGTVGLSSDVSSLTLQALTSEGTALSYGVVGGVLTATANGNTIFTLTIGGDGSYEFVLSGPLDHPIADSALDGETLAGLGIDFSKMITATDGDNDPLMIALPDGSFAIDVEDDVPEAREIGQRPWVSNQVDEDELPAGIGDGDGVNTVASGGAGALYAAINFGADGPGTIGLSNSPAGIAAMEAQGLTSGGVALSFAVVGNLLTATAGAEPIFTLQVNPDGSYTFTLLGPLDHPVADGSPAGDNEQLGSPIDFSALITATDGDNDPLSGLNPGSFVIQVEDDIPVAMPLQYDQTQQPIPLVSGQVDEDELPGGIVDGDGEGTSTSGGVGSLNALVDFGADGPGEFGLSDDPLDIATLEAQGLTSDGTALSYTVVGNLLTAMAGADTIFTLQVNPDGSYSFNLVGPLDHPLPGSTDDGQMLDLPIDFSGVLTATDGDHDPVDGFVPGSFVIEVEDDIPEAQDDSATVLAGQGLNFNVAFVLDFSGSIDDSELNTMLEAVRAAGQALFNGTSGDVNIQLVAFSGTAGSYPVVTDFASFSALLDSLNPADGGTRPFNGQTDFTAGIDETMAAYTPIPGWSNQVFFISDGNPNEQTGTGGNSLSDATAAAWDSFVDLNDINVTTIGVGNGINGPRLQDVDLDGSGAPILVDDFDDLVDTLVDQVIGGLVDGNVLQGNDGAVGGGDDDAFGADGPGQILSIEIDGVVYSWDGVLDGDEQLTDIPTPEGGKLSFNFNTGAWSYQAAAEVDGDRTETFDYVIVDNDGDPSTATLTINVEDTGPVEGYVDEDNLPDGIDDLDSVTDVATGSVAELVVGPDAGAHFTLSSDTSGITPATSGGVALVYSVLGDTLTATAGPAGPVVFTLQVADDGSYTFNLEQSLDHPLDGSDDGQLLTLDFTSILQANDGSNPLALAGNFLIHVEDDIPVIEVGRSGQDAGDLNTQDAQTIGAGVSDTATSNFSSAFTATTANHGADGPGAVTWNYSMVLLVAEGTLSGLSSDGDAIHLYQNGSGQIVGSTAGSEGAINAGNTIFTLSVNSGTGVVTLTQLQEIDHDLPGASSNYDAQEAVLGSGLVGLKGTATITDYDQDTDSDSLTLDLGGKVLFDDDGPSVSLGFGQNAEVLNTQDAQTIGGASDSDTDSFASAFTVTSQSFGADGPGTVSTSYALVLLTAEGSSSGLSSDGATIYLYESAGVIYGSTSATEGGVDPSNTIFSLSVNGAGQVTLTQFEEIDHSLPGVGSNYGAQEAVLGAGLVGLKGTVVITDDDGDTATDNKTLDLGGKVAFDDHGPSISVVFGTAPVPSLNTQDAQTIGGASDSDSGSFSGAFVVTPNHGADGPGTVTQTYSLNLLAGGNGPLSSGMNSSAGPIYLYKIGGEIVGSSSANLAGVAVGNTVFSLAVNTATGQVTLTQFQEISHDLPGSTSNYSNQEETLLAGKIGLTLTASITDGDGDFASVDKTLDLGGKIAFDDDGPSVSGNLVVQLDDDALANGIPGGPGGTDDANALNTGGVLAHNFGADGAGTVKWLDSGAPGGFTYQASPDGSQLLVKQGATTVLTLTLNTATGVYNVTQNAPIQHANADLENNQAFTLSYQVTDKDGDTATGTLSVNVDDDTPVAQDDVAYVSTGQTEDINMVFVLDFSGSISDSELNLMLDAVRTAGQELFNSAAGAVQIQIVAFSNDSIGYPAATDITTFTNLVNSLNPSEPGGVRPLDSTTDFTDAIQQTMVSYVPLPGWNNQVVFISDGNPNEQTGPGGAPSLTEPTATNWSNFVDGNGITITTIGIGDGINEDRLEDVDVDAGPNNDPLQVDDFDDLVDTLLDNVVGGLVNGNVLHGSDGINNGGTGDDDGYGADGPGRILSIEINGITYVWNGAGVIDPSSGANIAGNQLTDIPTAEGGELDFNFATGAWTYRAPSSGGGDKVETFDYVIVDKDGDPSEATLTVYVEDISPVIAKVDEDELPGGITDGDTETTIATGSIANLVVGPSAGVQFSLSGNTSGLDGASSGGTPLVYSVAGNTLTAKAGVAGPTVFTLQVENDGDYTFTLSGPLDHPAAGTNDNELLVLDFASILLASNGVNPVALAGQFLVQIENDVPTISAGSAAADSLQVDETNLAVNANASFAASFSGNYGGDGAGTTTYSLQVSASGVDSGLDDVATGSNILLFLEGGNVVGRVGSAAGAVSFTVSVNASGVVTLDQQRAIAHTPNTTADQESSLASANLVQLSATITDKDGDTATASVNLGSAISFKDDGPSISAGVVSANSLQVDETNLSTNASVSFAGAFTPSYGADGAGTTTYGLNVSAAGVDSGLDDAATGSNILLFLEGSNVVGRVGGAAGAVSFTVSVNASGVVTLDQQRAIMHTPNSGPDQEASLAAANLVQLTATITDRDGDSNNATINLGEAISFRDDAPSISATAAAGNDSLQVDETVLATNATTNFAGLFSGNYGADGAGTTTYSLNVSAAGVDSGLDDSVTGSNILLFNEAGVIVGRVGGAAGPVSFTVSVNASGQVTLDQQRAIIHTPNSGADQESSLSAANLVQLSATITDKDGDTATASVNLGNAISFRDDGPSISAATAVNDSLQVDETFLASNASTNYAALFTSSYGADGAGTTTYSLNVSAAGVDSGLDDSITGSNILLFNEAGVIVGRVGNAAGPVSFTVSVNASGQVTLDQQRAIVHTPNSGADQESSLSAANLVQLSATITDKDGDAATASVNLGSAISFRDDGPSISPNAVAVDSLQVDESNLAGNASTSFAGAFTGSYGADGAGTTVYSLNVSAAGVDSGLDDSLTGSNILLFLEAGNVVGRVGSAAGAISFTVAVNTSTGTVTLDQQRAIIHTPNSGPDQETSLASANLVQLTATITDKDGDATSASVGLGSAISFRDDAPTAVSQTQSGQATVSLNSNLLIVLDISGSMGWESGVGDMDRLQVAKNALLELLEQYDALGDVRVSLVSFSTGADVEATWVTVAQAKAAILSLNPEDSTNYDAALIDAINVYDDAGKLATGNVQNVAYFLSDGFPNAPSGDAGISSTAGSAAGWPTPYSNGGVSEEQAWINFLTANNIRSYALGMGTGVDAGALNPIAYNGTTGGGNTNAIEVDDLNDLAATLTATAQASPIPGNLTTGGGFGSDGGFVQVLVVDGKTYTYDKATNTFVASGPGANNGSLLGTVLTVNMGGGSGIAVNMLNGSYTYTPPSVINTAVITTIAFTLIDADGDAAAANLNININPGQGPMVIRDDLILTNTDTQTGQDAISIPTWALLANDTGPSSGLLSVLNASGASDGSVGLAGSTVTFTEEGNNSTDGGRFVYGASINGSTTLDSAVVDVTRSAGSNTLNGTFRNEILLGRDGSADVLNGGDGDDVLIGLGGNDTLNGGEGNDILAGGAGTDTLNGGNGVDTANYIDAALGVTVSLNTGAAQNTVGAGTDTLSNIENLFGSNLIDTLTGNGSANVLFGAGGNDTLVGLGGDDFLIGGLGGDTMSGGSGKDTYVWQKGGLGGGTDHITDFNVDITGVNSDKLDLSQLLSGVGTDSNILQNYLDFSFAGTTTTIDVRTVAAGPVEQQVILDNVNLSTLYGSANEATIITNLLDDNALKTA